MVNFFKRLLKLSTFSIVTHQTDQTMNYEIFQKWVTFVTYFGKLQLIPNFFHEIAKISQDKLFRVTFVKLDLSNKCYPKFKSSPAHTFV